MLPWPEYLYFSLDCAELKHCNLLGNAGDLSYFRVTVAVTAESHLGYSLFPLKCGWKYVLLEFHLVTAARNELRLVGERVTLTLFFLSQFIVLHFPLPHTCRQRELIIICFKVECMIYLNLISLRTKTGQEKSTCFGVCVRVWPPELELKLQLLLIHWHVSI